LRDRLARFGNLIRNITCEHLGGAGPWWVEVGDECVGVGVVRDTFADVEVGQRLAYVGSGGTIEVAVRDGSAAAAGFARGERVRLWRDDA
jgi:S-adenosylmethionine hydrolase